MQRPLDVSLDLDDPAGGCGCKGCFKLFCNIVCDVCCLFGACLVLGGNHGQINVSAGPTGLHPSHYESMRKRDFYEEVLGMQSEVQSSSSKDEMNFIKTSAKYDGFAAQEGSKIPVRYSFTFTESGTVFGQSELYTRGTLEWESREGDKIFRTTTGDMWNKRFIRGYYGIKQDSINIKCIQTYKIPPLDPETAEDLDFSEMRGFIEEEKQVYPSFSIISLKGTVADNTVKFLTGNYSSTSGVQGFIQTQEVSRFQGVSKIK